MPLPFQIPTPEESVFPEEFGAKSAQVVSDFTQPARFFDVTVDVDSTDLVVGELVRWSGSAVDVTGAPALTQDGLISARGSIYKVIAKTATTAQLRNWAEDASGNAQDTNAIQGSIMRAGGSLYKDASVAFQKAIDTRRPVACDPARCYPLLSVPPNGKKGQLLLSTMGQTLFLRGAQIFTNVPFNSGGGDAPIFYCDKGSYDVTINDALLVGTCDFNNLSTRTANGQHGVQNGVEGDATTGVPWLVINNFAAERLGGHAFHYNEVQQGGPDINQVNWKQCCFGLYVGHYGGFLQIDGGTVWTCGVGLRVHGPDRIDHGGNHRINDVNVLACYVNLINGVAATYSHYSSCLFTDALFPKICAIFYETIFPTQFADCKLEYGQVYLVGSQGPTFDLSAILDTDNVVLARGFNGKLPIVRFSGRQPLTIQRPFRIYSFPGSIMTWSRVDVTTQVVSSTDTPPTQYEGIYCQMSRTSPLVVTTAQINAGIQIGWDKIVDNNTGMQAAFGVGGTIASVANTTPIQITTEHPHNYQTGDVATPSGTGIGAIDSIAFVVTRVDANKITLNGTVASGVSTTGRIDPTVSVASVRNTTPVQVVTDLPHSQVSGDSVTFTGTGIVDGTWVIDVIDEVTMSLRTSAASGSSVTGTTNILYVREVTLQLWDVANQQFNIEGYGFAHSKLNIFDVGVKAAAGDSFADLEALIIQKAAGGPSVPVSVVSIQVDPSDASKAKFSVNLSLLTSRLDGLIFFLKAPTWVGAAGTALTMQTTAAENVQASVEGG